MNHHSRSILLIILAVFLGILFGLVEASLWVSGNIPQVRFIFPYAAADALLIFALTPILAVFSNKMRNSEDSDCGHCHSDSWLSGYVRTIMISSTAFLIFTQVYVGTVLPRMIKIPLSFVGSISFWIMLIVFLAMVFHLVRRR